MRNLQQKLEWIHISMKNYFKDNFELKYFTRNI